MSFSNALLRKREPYNSLLATHENPNFFFENSKKNKLLRYVDSYLGYIKLIVVPIATST